jgi:hypothetical protein
MRRLATESVSNEALELASIPRSDGGWKEIEKFALTLNGYEALGQRLGELAETHARAGTLPVELTELRGCLFFEQRRWRQFEEPPEGKPMEHILRLLEAIRSAVAAR